MSEGTHFETYEDGAGEYRWRLVASNGKVVADSGEGYTREEDVVRALYALRVWVEVGFTNLVPQG